MAQDRDAERRSREERRAAVRPGRIPPEDFHPTIEDTLSQMRELVHPLGPTFVAHLDHLVGLVQSGAVSHYTFEMKQQGPVPVDVRVDLAGQGQGPAVHAWAEGLINGERVRSGGLLVRTPGNGTYWLTASQDQTDPVITEGTQYPHPKQPIGYIQQNKLPRRPIMIPNATRDFPNGFEVVEIVAGQGQRVVKTPKEHSVLVRLRKL